MLVGTSSREQSLISIMLRSCQGGAVDHQCHRRRVRGSPRVDIYILYLHTAVQLRISPDGHWRIYLTISLLANYMFH